jgi:hypothetical protein
MNKVAWLVLTGFLCIGIFQVEPLHLQFSRNMADLAASAGFLADSSQLPAATKMLNELSASDCREGWLLGLAYDRLGQTMERERSWGILPSCPSDYVTLLYGLRIENPDWAMQALAAHPGNPDAWFWAAYTLTGNIQVDGRTELIDPEDYDRVIWIYRQGLALDRGNSIAWRELGDLLHDRDPKGAIEAYLQSCYHGDRGSNGCYRAGLTAEEGGDYKNAIQYYRLSRWSVARERANRLEGKLLEEDRP